MELRRNPRHRDDAGVRLETVVHPLRSPWWMLLFALALSGEWVLRRHAGLR
jgi:hypothetical protein